VTPVRLNGRWSLDLPDHRSRQWANPWEPERIDSMHRHLTVNDTLYDIGTEEGDIPALCASWGARLVMIEPDPRVWPNVRACFTGNDLEGKVVGVFVGFAGPEDRYESVPVRWELGSQWPECAFGPIVDDHGFMNLSERPDVESVRIDTLAALLPAPTAITVDVEGAELAVMQGAGNVLAWYRPLVWVSVHPEFMREMYGHTPDMLFRFMIERGYRYRLLAVDHEEHWLFWPHERGDL
jgi:FkbM family methyltransferase